MDKLKIAYVKSSLYWDLWVCDISSNYFDLLKTTLLRCPAIALSEKLNTDFIIIKETFQSSEELYHKLTPGIFNIKNNLQYSNLNKNPDLNFLDETHHKHTTIDNVSHDVNTIDWLKYDIVITINMCIPSYIIHKYPSILWCYITGENTGEYIETLYKPYDIVLNQDLTKVCPEHSIGFPYTFLHPYTLENINKNLINNTTSKNGIYMEINNTTQRPVTEIPLSIMEISNVTNLHIYIHSQNIIQNIKNMYNSKYFLKLEGRNIRGNAVLEAISAGCVIIANPNLVRYNDLIHETCKINDNNDAIRIITYLENNPVIYNEVLQFQREYMELHYYKTPLENLYKHYLKKKSLL